MQIKSRFRFMAFRNFNISHLTGAKIVLLLEGAGGERERKEKNYGNEIGTKCFANSNRLQMNANAIILFR